MAEAQLPLDSAAWAAARAPAAPVPDGCAAFEMDSSAGRLLVRSTDGQVGMEINPATGILVALRSGGRQLLASPLEPWFYRAATDNDRGGSGGTSYAAR